MLLVRQAGLGSVSDHDRGFGGQMLDRFLHSLEKQSIRPLALCFYTEGVQACCEGSDALLGLQLLAEQGVRILVCRTCLEHYGMLERIAVGTLSSMDEIVSVLLEADSTITI